MALEGGLAREVDMVLKGGKLSLQALRGCLGLSGCGSTRQFPFLYPPSNLPTPSHIQMNCSGRGVLKSRGYQEGWRAKVSARGWRGC